MFYFLIGFFLNFIIFKLIKPILKKNFIVFPNERSSHKVATPSGGGISFVITIIIILLINGLGNQFSSNYQSIFFASSFLGLIGLFDDYFDLPTNIRFLIQFLVAYWIIKDSNFSNSAIILQFLIGFVGISLINFFNFVDGIDGLLAGSMIVLLSSSIIFLSLSPVFWALVGALSLFLIFNWSPANIFMGDVGSLFLGSIFFGISVNADNFENMIRILFIASPIFFDAIFCIIRRKFAGENIFIPHKKHLYQRLVEGGMNHSQVSAIYILSIVFLALINNFYNIYLLLISSFCIFLFGIILDLRFASNFK